MNPNTNVNEMMKRITDLVVAHGMEKTGLHPDDILAVFSVTVQDEQFHVRVTENESSTTCSTWQPRNTLEEALREILGQAELL